MVVYFNPNIVNSYQPGGRTITDLVSGKVGTISGPFTSIALGEPTMIQLNNDKSVAANNNSGLKIESISGIRSISMWVFIESIIPTTGMRYLLDARPGLSDGWIASGGTGDNWKMPEYFLNMYPESSYTNQANDQNMTDLLNTTNRWFFVTLKNKRPFSGSLSLFTNFSGTEGLYCTFGPILLYDRLLSREDHNNNFYSDDFTPYRRLMKT